MHGPLARQINKLGQRGKVNHLPSRAIYLAFWAQHVHHVHVLVPDVWAVPNVSHCPLWCWGSPGGCNQLNYDQSRPWLWPRPGQGEGQFVGSAFWRTRFKLRVTHIPTWGGGALQWLLPCNSYTSIFIVLILVYWLRVFQFGRRPSIFDTCCRRCRWQLVKGRGKKCVGLCCATSCPSPAA